MLLNETFPSGQNPPMPFSQSISFTASTDVCPVYIKRYLCLCAPCPQVTMTCPHSHLPHIVPTAMPVEIGSCDLRSMQAVTARTFRRRRHLPCSPVTMWWLWLSMESFWAGSCSTAVHSGGLVTKRNQYKILVDPLVPVLLPQSAISSHNQRRIFNCKDDAFAHFRKRECPPVYAVHHSTIDPKSPGVNFDQ